LPVKTYRIWIDKELSIPWYAGSTNDNRKIRIVWDEKRTEILSARLEIIARGNGRTNLKIRVNDNVVSHFHWEIWEDMATKSDDVDIVSLLANGDNLFIADFYKDFLHPFDVRCVFSVILKVEYEGESPEERPWWERWLMPGLTAASVALGGVGVVLALKKEKKE